MNLNVKILNRDFTTPPIKPYEFKVDKLTWTAFGGCDQGLISTFASSDRLLEFSSLLRCPVLISDSEWEPCWWGYVDQITMAFDNVRFTVDIDRLFNRVQVRYSFISPDRKFSELLETPFYADELSRDVYGTREKIIYLRNVDDFFSENFARTFLNTYAWDTVEFSPNKSVAASLDFQQTKISLRLSGWFSTLGWTYYQDIHGLYANHGPGPGVVNIGDTVTSLIAQSFYPERNIAIKYAYFLLRKQSTPTSTLTAHIYDSSSGFPGANLATSLGFSGMALDRYSYQWVRFEFDPPYTVTGLIPYWIVLNPNTSHATRFYSARIDEAINFVDWTSFAARYTTAWGYIPSVTAPDTRPDLYFRVVGVSDTGTILNDIATAGNQFFSGIQSFTTGIATSPYRDNARTCLDETLTLMRLGTSNYRRILATVTPERELIFYEQPPKEQVDGYMDRFGRFFTKDMKPLPPYRPPIGKNVMLSSHDRVVLPFDFERTPTYFVDRFTFSPK